MITHLASNKGQKTEKKSNENESPILAGRCEITVYIFK